MADISHALIVSCDVIFDKIDLDLILSLVLIITRLVLPLSSHCHAARICGGNNVGPKMIKS